MGSTSPSPIKLFLNSFEGSIDLAESIEDSPQFRKQLKDTEASIEDLSSNIKKILKSSKLSCELGNEYNTTFKSFVDDLLVYKGEAGSGFSRDELLEKSMIKFSNSLKEICNFRELLHEEMNHLISEPLQNFAETDLKHVKEQYKRYDKYSQQYETSASKLGQIKKKNSVKIEELSQEANESLKLRVQYGLDLVESMNQVQARRRFEFLEYFSVYLQAQSTFFHQGYELFRDLEPHIRVFSNYLQATRKNYEDQKKKQTMQKADLIEKTFLSTSPTSISGSPINGGIIFTPNRTSDTMSKRGYLFKRSDYNSYTRKFFSLDNGKLSYYRSANDTAPSHTYDLFLTTVRVREDLDRRYCFELLSPDRSIILAAENPESMQEWIQVLQNATANLLNNCSKDNSPNCNNNIINNLNNNNNNNNNNNSSSSSNNNSNNSNQNINNQNNNISNQNISNNNNNNNNNNNQNNNNNNNNQNRNRSGTPLGNNNNYNNMMNLNSSWGSNSSSNISCGTTNPNSMNSSGNNIGLNFSGSSINSNSTMDDITPLSLLRRIDQSNNFCADCNAKDPDWASINFGSIICIDCSGIHRSLGTHISKVRSLVLDKWEPELLGMMKCIGNERVNKIFEEKVPSDRKKPTTNDTFDIRSRWIRDKYDKRIFVNYYDRPIDEINSILYHIAAESNTGYILELLAKGADPNYRDSHHHNKTPLFNAVLHNQAQNVCLLIQNGAFTDIQDDHGNTILHCSADSGASNCCILILMKSVKLLSITNKSSQTPLDLAVDKGHVGCVAILRLAQLHKDEGKSNFDETFAEVLRGFSKEK